MKAPLLLLAEAAAEASSPTWLGVPVLWWKLANLLLFLLGLAYLLARPLSRFFHARREEIANQLAEAEKLKAEALALQETMAARLAALEEETRALQERLRQEGEKERARLQAEGEREAAKLLRQVEEEAQRRLASAREQLAQEAAQAAAAAAWELLRREITPEDQERIFQATLARLAQEGKA
jgi:F-type H+-transporting ATPase subunit b